MSWLAGGSGVPMASRRASISASMPLSGYAELLPYLIRQAAGERARSFTTPHRRQFHDYFVTHLPSSSLHPDSRAPSNIGHKFDRKSSTPHTGSSRSAPVAASAISRDTTVVRIPLKSAKHHYGAFVSRGQRPYNEDSHQAGVIELPAFAKRQPKSLSLKQSLEATGADSASGDPQVFYFGVFDGHGGAECSGFLREELHTYLERTAMRFQMSSSLHDTETATKESARSEEADQQAATEALRNIAAVDKKDIPDDLASGQQDNKQPSEMLSAPPVIQEADQDSIREMEKDLVQNWKKLVGGYFRRFKPAYFSIYGDNTEAEKHPSRDAGAEAHGTAIEEVVTFAFLKADYDFVAAQAAREKEATDTVKAERPLNEDDHIIGSPGYPKTRKTEKSFKGGSTCSIAMVSTPTPTPFWHPATPSSMLVAHVGDTRVLLCATATGIAVPLTTDHHPSSPIEATRLRRYAATFVTDSFGEERISGLANTRAFGDIGSKRIGVSAEPEIRRVELGAAEYSFMVLVSDGVSGTLSDQEIVDIVKEAKTPEQGAQDVVNFATEVTTEGDNATCLVVRLGGWERRQEGGYGSLGTKESRDYKRQEALDPRNSRR